MNWHYEIAARNGARLTSRVLHVFDQQQISTQSIASRKVGEDEVHLHIVIEAEEPKAVRIRNLLLRLEDLRSLTVTQGQPANGV